MVNIPHLFHRLVIARSLLCEPIAVTACKQRRWLPGWTKKYARVHPGAETGIASQIYKLYFNWMAPIIWPFDWPRNSLPSQLTEKPMPNLS